ncbi:MAG: hypothetical protein JST26_12175 [Bacteroidetes bacterium]|nr:hypothetical protein [Bacteroidota bacterium]
MTIRTSQLNTWYDNIRLRPAMYLGNTDTYGFKQLLEYLFSDILKQNSENPVFDITFLPDNKIVLRFSGISTDKIPGSLAQMQKEDSTMTELGLPVIIALSTEITITINSTDRSYTFHGMKGSFESHTNSITTGEPVMIVEATIDMSILKNFHFHYDHLTGFFRQFTFLNPGLKIIASDKTNNDFQRNVFLAPRGIFDQLDYYASKNIHYSDFSGVEIEDSINDYSYQITISAISCYPYQPFTKTYAGNTELYYGGSLQDGILDGVTQVIRQAAEKQNTKVLINRKKLKQQLTIIAAVKGKDYSYAGSTKRKLDMPQLRKDVKTLVANKLLNYFSSSPEITDKLLGRFLDLRT